MVLAVRRGPEHQPAALEQLAKHRAAGIDVLSDALLEVERDPGDLVHGREVDRLATAPLQLLDQGVLRADVVLQLAQVLADVLRALAALDEVHDVEAGQVLRTHCFAEPDPTIHSAHLAKQLALFMRVVDVKFAFGFRTDSPNHFYYLNFGLSRGRPDWLFTIDGATVTVHEGTRANIAKLPRCGLFRR